MKKICLILCTLAICQMGWAEKKKLTGGFGAATDYLWRGITFSNHKPIVKGGIDFSYKGLSLGNWVSTSQGWGSSSEESENGLENALYGKYSLSFANNLSGHVGAIYFYYPHNEQARYGRVYVGLKWKDNSGKHHVTLEVGAWDYEAKSGPGESDSLEYRMKASLGPIHLMAIWEEDHFLGTGYQYYQAQTEIGAPKEWEFPEDFCLGVTLGYANYDDEANFGTTSYFHYLFSLNRVVDGFRTSLFFSDTTREAPSGPIPGSGGVYKDETIGLSFLKTF